MLGTQEEISACLKGKGMGKVPPCLPQTVAKCNGVDKISTCCSLALFEILRKMLDVNYPLSAQPEAEQSQSQLSEQNKDIVHFIGGSVLQKLKQRLTRQKDCTAKEEKLQCIDNMLEKEGSDEASLTSTLNRGDCFS